MPFLGGSVLIYTASSIAGNNSIDTLLGVKIFKAASEEILITIHTKKVKIKTIITPENGNYY